MLLRDVQAVSHVLGQALVQGLIGEEDTAVMFLDLGAVAGRIRELRRSFPTDALHAVAMKANPVFRLLTRLRELGAGVETASLPELHLALAAGFRPQDVVYDSPAKTEAEIRFALERGVRLNADNLDELERIGAQMAGRTDAGIIGVRINPQVGAGRIRATSVAAEYSKFGVPIGLYREELLEAFGRWEWLRGLHLHSGSQGCGLDLLVQGCRVVYDFALEVNRRFGAGRVRGIDIGGGLPVSYGPTDLAVPASEYVRSLRALCPGLFDGTFQVVTEFGRYVLANAGWTASRVEYVKKDRGVETAVIHVGADLLLRRAYRPEDWHHHVAVLDACGRPKTGAARLCHVAGPLCFAGDFVAESLELPAMVPGDFLVVFDTGAYTLGMWSRYSSRQIPMLLGYEESGGCRFRVLRERESVAQVLAFWGAGAGNAAP